MADNHKTSQHLNDINQEFKEKEIEKQAQKLGLSYINLLNFKVNPDVLSLLDEHHSKLAKMVVFFQIGKKIRIALSDPENIHAKKLIQEFKTENFSVNINIASEESIQKVQELYKNSLYKKEETDQINLDQEEVIAAEAIQDFEDHADSEFLNKKSIEILNQLHKLAIQTQCSDIHFQPEKDSVYIRFRIDGMLQNISNINYKVYEGIVKQIKVNAHLKINLTQEVQEGQYYINVSKRDIDIRVAVLPSIYGESLVLRILDSEKGILSLKELGFKKHALEQIANTLTKTDGMILLAGPTGSGKTTTLYSILNVLNRPYRKIITLEDPVEYKMSGVLQCEASYNEHDDNNISFKKGLIALLRQDPDIIMLGEIRESTVANIAFQASITGHLVVSTIHANSSLDTLTRIKNLGINNYLLAPAIKTIIFQRLLRQICPHCTMEKERSLEDTNYIQKIYKDLKNRNIKIRTPAKKEKYGKGCKYCNNTGYLGRIAATEILFISDTIKNMIQEQESKNKILSQAISEGFITLKEDAMMKVIEGKTTLEELRRIL